MHPGVFFFVDSEVRNDCDHSYEALLRLASDIPIYFRSQGQSLTCMASRNKFAADDCYSVSDS
jgi:hypothetical protein